ncbi:MAG: SNF2 helicase-associated domain-containing protein, partial [Acidimicrobiales bacterium]
MEIELDRITVEAAVVAEATGYASSTEAAWLESHQLVWISALRRLLTETDEAWAHADRIRGEEREQVLADLAGERRHLADALARVTGESVPEAPEHSSAAVPDRQARSSLTPSAPQLQASWADGRLAVWAGGPGATVPDDTLDGLLAAADASGIPWEHPAPVAVLGGTKAEARSAHISQVLGWLVGVGAGQLGGQPAAGASAKSGDAEGRDPESDQEPVSPVAPSLRWMGEVAVWGAELVAQGRMVPVLRGSSGGGSRGMSKHRVRWVPALVARDRLQGLVNRMPGATAALQAAAQPEGVCRSVLSAVVDAVSRAGADRLVAPATLPQASSRADISEAVLSGLDGRPFMADGDQASRLADDLKRWASSVTMTSRVGLTVRLDPPADDGGWLLRVEATGVDKTALPIEHALVVASGTKSQQVEAQMRRLERLLPVLRRPSTRRGQVILDGEEAGELMFTSGPMVAAAGFDVLLPMVSRRRPSPQLRLFAEAIGGQSQVGVQQLANVRWTVLFDDLELDAKSIAKLANEAKPLIQVKGRWVHLDRADLAAAAAALAERASITQLSGAALVRQAVGLE